MKSELSTVLTVTCESNFDWSKEVIGSNEHVYTVAYGESQLPQRKETHEFSCTCLGFRFKGACKHIEAVQHERCGWGFEAFAGTVYNKSSCPDCGGKVRTIEVAV